MQILKKLVFAPFFIIAFATLTYLLTPFLTSYDFIFSLSSDTLISLLIIGAFISASSLLFVLFVTLSADWRISTPAGIIASTIPFLFIPLTLALVFSVIILASFLLINLALDNTLKSYLTFKPSSLLGPAVKNLSGLLILSFCIIYFLSINKVITQQGFQIPDSLIDTALKMTPMGLSAPSDSVPAQLPTISPEQIELLKQNPELLKQSGLDPKILDTLDQPKSAENPQDLTNDLIKQTVKDQIQNFIKPYLGFLPALLAILLFVSLQSLTSILNLFIPPLLWLTFYILEKTGFIKFEIEQRPVKKIVI